MSACLEALSSGSEEKTQLYDAASEIVQRLCEDDTKKDIWAMKSRFRDWMILAVQKSKGKLIFVGPRQQHS